MADQQLIIIGGGLSGLAAGIRAARFGIQTLILEQHVLPGGLNSYYFRQGRLFESGLHAMTNYAPASEKRAPLNLLFRQLRLSRRDFSIREQIGSEIRFPGRQLVFTNDIAVLEAAIAQLFPQAIDRFRLLRRRIAEFDPFAAAPWRSARAFFAETLHEPPLEEMLFLPLMVYGNAEEHDMDLRQCVIMFRAVFEEGFFRPQTSIREFLNLLLQHYQQLGGLLRCSTPVAKILSTSDKVLGVRLETGEEISADAVLSTAGLPETIRLSGWSLEAGLHSGRMSFMETISVVEAALCPSLRRDKTIVFYSNRDSFAYQRPDRLVNHTWGVICFPEHFSGVQAEAELSVRVTNPASYPHWRALDQQSYGHEKKRCAAEAVTASEDHVGAYGHALRYQDSFTPLTIERFSRKAEGAVYGCPRKLRDGRSPWPNLFIAGTDQGYLGIVGAMLSGVSIVNQHLLH